MSEEDVDSAHVTTRPHNLVYLRMIPFIILVSVVCAVWAFRAEDIMLPAVVFASVAITHAVGGLLGVVYDG